MRRFIVFLYCLTCLCLTDHALAQSFGNLLTKDQIYTMSVQGFKLDMTMEQTKNILKRDGWEGKWINSEQPDFNFPFIKGIYKLYLLTYEASEHKRRLYSIVAKQSVERSLGGNTLASRAIGTIWMDTVIAEFGPPSMEFSNHNGINSYVYYHIHRTKDNVPKLEAYLNGFEASYELSDRSLIHR